jgi:ATP-dependent Lon protease
VPTYVVEFLLGRYCASTEPAEIEEGLQIVAYAPGWDFPKLNPNEHLTGHFGLVSDFLSECWSRLRVGSRLAAMQNRIHLGGALSGRDIEGVNKMVSALIKLLFPDPEMEIPDEDLEWIVRLALESRRRVKEQQKRCLKSEFRNTHFSYTLGLDGVEKFVATPELHSDDAIDGDPLPPGQVWAISPGTGDTGPSLYRIEVAVGPGSGVKILNQPVPPAFRESTKVGEQNVYARAKSLVGDRDPRGHEFSIQLRAMYNDRSGAGLGLPVMVALVGGLLDRNTRGSTIIVGSLNLGGSIEMIPNAIAIAELAVEKQAKVLLMPVSARRGLNDLPDDLWTKISIEFYKDPEDAVFKGVEE